MKLAGRLRRSFWRHVRRYHFETCDACGRPVGRALGSYWLAEDVLWNEVEGNDWEIRCPRCFTADAASAGVHVSWRAVRDP